MATPPARPPLDVVALEEPTQRILRKELDEDATLTGRSSPTLSEDCLARLSSALATNAEVEVGLVALFRAAQHFSAGVSGARAVSEQLSRELGELASKLTESSEQELLLRNRIAILEQSSIRAERERTAERACLFEQQDAFIVLLCDDHQRELRELMDRQSRTTDLSLQEAQRIGLETKTAELTAAQEEILQLRMEREQLRDDLLRAHSEREEVQHLVVRMASERDQALIELSRTRSNERLRTLANSKPPDGIAHPVARLELEALPRSSQPSSPRHSSQPESKSFYASPIVSVSAPPAFGAEHSVPSSRPPLKQKPDPSTRPLIGYSLGGSELAAEQLEGASLASRLPDR